VITAEIDPLMSEGKTLADKLKAAGSRSPTRASMGQRTSSSAWLPWWGMPKRRRTLLPVS
jgi:acetyl esterase/lipase